ncbi:MAG: formyltransferase family protein [Bernardetiaceae bacterium]
MNIIACIDHQIGYRLAVQLIQLQKLGEITNLWLYTNPRPAEAFWDDCFYLKEVYTFENIFAFNNDQEIIKHTKNYVIDYIFLLSWKHLVSKELIEHSQKGCINLHYSLLPKFRGVYPVNWAIINGEKETGLTFHFVNQGIDAGDIILQRKLSISLTETAKCLLERLDDLAEQAFRELWDMIKSYQTLPRRPQTIVADYYSRKRFLQICQLSLTETVTGGELLNLLRGTTFGAQSNLYFLDEKQQKVYITIQFHPE